MHGETTKKIFSVKIIYDHFRVELLRYHLITLLIAREAISAVKRKETFQKPLCAIVIRASIHGEFLHSLIVAIDYLAFIDSNSNLAA